MRVDSQKMMCGMLNVADDDEFARWLAQPWVVAVYDEFAEVELEPARAVMPPRTT